MNRRTLPVLALGALLATRVEAPEKGRTHQPEALPRVRVGDRLPGSSRTQHQSLVRRIHVKPDYILYLVDEQRILGKFEALTPVRGQSESSPNSMETGSTQPASCGQRAQASDENCFFVFREWLEYFKDHHLFVMESPKFSEAEVQQLTANAPSVSICEGEIKTYLGRNGAKLNQIDDCGTRKTIDTQLSKTRETRKDSSR